MTAIVYPPELPGPQSAPIQRFDGRAVSPGDGPRVQSAKQRQWVGHQSCVFPLLDAAQAAIFDAWWETTLSFGGSEFTAAWPIPQGVITATRRFIGEPRWDYLGAGKWRVSADFEVTVYPLAPGGDGGEPITAQLASENNIDLVSEVGDLLVAEI